ncbi:MAG: glycoside hydrolase family 65 protein [Bacteroidia bacterium]|nr:glycoside hydrolase family 65 protein [Bacteroidia bacterium]
MVKDYIVKHEWKIIENGFHPEYSEISESLFSVGNGKTGLRGNFEESYSGKTLQGSYNAGIYYPDKTKVGWWKNGYPEYFAKVLNACNWIGLQIKFNEEELDLNKTKILDFERVLDMQHGLLERSFKTELESGKKIQVKAERFTSMHDDETACLKYEIKSIDFKGTVSISSFLDFDVMNQDSNYDEKFWVGKSRLADNSYCFVHAETLKTKFNLGLGLQTTVKLNDKPQEVIKNTDRDKFASSNYAVSLNPGDTCIIHKYVSFGSSLYHKEEDINAICKEKTDQIQTAGYNALRNNHTSAWADIWRESDIKIDGDVSAQQGIRFNIFHLKQTYTGKDSRLNIGPKGFTGEKYGGSTYWDTEAYCLPFYQSTAAPQVGRQLLKYRYNQLDKAIENAEKLGFINGAALYPMVTMNGEECHNEWEITFEEIHRNGAIAYAIYDFIRYNNDHEYLYDGGLDVLIGIARFWAQRVNWSSDKKQYVILGVTGPNEYENNVNNNWYTNYIARWCLNYTRECLELARNENNDFNNELLNRLNLSLSEIEKWKDIAENIYLPYDNTLKIFLQQDGFLDKELLTAEDLDQADKPINQNWSWDRILRSVFIKQADVLQGMYFFEDDFTEAEHMNNFDFYEPRTVHESSLSPCVHAILACKLGKKEKAYEMYLRTARLDLEDYNNDTEDGLHITSMAGTWMSVIKGFGGMRIKDNQLHFHPSLPDQWEACHFKIMFRNSRLNVHMTKAGTTISKETGELDSVFINGREIDFS